MNERMLRILKIMLLAASATVLLTGQERPRLSQDTLAWVDGQPVLARELRARVELMPWPGPVRPSTMDSVRSQALSALIAERLLATDGDSRGLTMDRRHDLLRWGLVNVLMRDALFQREVAGRVRPTRQESIEALRRYREHRSALVLVTGDRTDADSVAALLSRGRSPGNVLRDRRVLDADTVMATFGMTDTLLERLVYGVGPSGVSRPERLAADRWVIVRIVSRTANPSAEKQSPEDQRRSADRVLQSRIDGRTAERYFRTTLATRRARSDSASFFRLARAISEIWLADTARYRRASGFELTSDMVDLLHARLGEAGSFPLVSMEPPDLSISQVVEMFRYAPFLSTEAEGLRFWNRLNEQVQGVVAGEYLAREAHARGLHSDPEVQRDLRWWNQYWAAGAMVRAIRETVTVTRDDVVREMIAHRERFRGKASVMTEEIWSADLNEAMRLAVAVREGSPIASLAAERPRRAKHIGPDGRTGWYDPADDAVVGFHAWLADSGALIGPVAADKGFVTFRVLGVRTSEGSLRGGALARAIEPEARSRAAHERVNAYVAEQARRRQIKVEAEVVKRLGLTNVPMFTRRYLGFGGWMNGAPMLLPLWEWVRQLPDPALWPL